MKSLMVIFYSVQINKNHIKIYATRLYGESDRCLCLSVAAQMVIRLTLLLRCEMKGEKIADGCVSM